MKFQDKLKKHYVAVALYDTSDIQMVPQIATALRYVHDGKIQEKSLTTVLTSLDDFFSHGQNVVAEFSVESKLVAQAYDGASVMGGHLNDLQHEVLEAYHPHAVHVHCYLHVFNLVLPRSCNNVK
jgi:hypothetical protein